MEKSLLLLTIISLLNLAIFISAIWAFARKKRIIGYVLLIIFAVIDLTRYFLQIYSWPDVIISAIEIAITITVILPLLGGYIYKKIKKRK